MRDLLVLLLSILLTTIALADEFVVTAFKTDPSDVSARVHAKKDVNGDYCAIIKVRTGLKNLKFHSNQLSDLDQKTGEYWLYVSPGIRYLEIMKDGFAKKGYEIPKKVRSQNVYLLNLTSKNQTQLKVISKPAESKGSQIYINGNLKKKVTPALFNLDPGKYYITLRHPDFISLTKETKLQKSQKEDIIFNMDFYQGSNLQKYRTSKRNKWIGLLSGLVMIGAGGICNQLADQAYNDYQSSTTTQGADNYWDKYNTYNNIRNISYSVSAAPLVYGLVNWYRQLKFNNKLEK